MFLRLWTAASFHQLHRPLRCATALLGRPFTTGASIPTKALPPRMKLPDQDIHYVFLKGSGPGGQKINKTSSAVQMTHVPTGLVVKNQTTRSRAENFGIARRILADQVELRLKGDESRVAKLKARIARKKAKRERKSKRKQKLILVAKENKIEGEVEMDEVAAEVVPEEETTESVTDRGEQVAKPQASETFTPQQ